MPADAANNDNSLVPASHNKEQGLLALTDLADSTHRFAAALQIRRRREEAAKRREARDAHHHKDLWAKHPHGGPYYKVAKREEASQLTKGVNEKPEDLLGYEHVPHKGPTTNFVGDAMSSAAVDLVHEELKSSHALPSSAAPANPHKKLLPSQCGPASPPSEIVPHSSTSDTALPDKTASFHKLWQRLQAQGKI